jgi:hypothetical protein
MHDVTWCVTGVLQHGRFASVQGVGDGCRVSDPAGSVIGIGDPVAVCDDELGSVGRERLVVERAPRGKRAPDIKSTVRNVPIRCLIHVDLGLARCTGVDHGGRSGVCRWVKTPRLHAIRSGSRLAQLEHGMSARSQGSAVATICSRAATSTASCRSGKAKESANDMAGSGFGRSSSLYQAQRRARRAASTSSQPGSLGLSAQAFSSSLQSSSMKRATSSMSAGLGDMPK